MTNSQSAAKATGATVKAGPVAAPNGSSTPQAGGGSKGTPATAVCTVTDGYGTRSVLPLDLV
ncbi:hypothetical protein [Kitasatospora sp. NBC_01300]|uniref:hypothetical protein n=1 Tax=Kitasatospora sp. NBC_01300 TaxID=2903574 RepID=UPI002F90D2A1|nr:hypothetical protein OG556_40320 [Kitasatospora sp. NBC_01300]